MSNDSVLPDWVDDLKVISNIGPNRWAAQRIVDFILGAVATVVFGAANLIDTQFEIVTDAIELALSPLPNGIEAASTALTSTVTDINGLVVNIVGLSGPLAPVLVIGFWTLVAILLWRALIASLPAIVEALGSIPVLGTALAPVLQWAIEFANIEVGK